MMLEQIKMQRVGDRVYRQHLIGVAVELLQNSDIDWTQVKNTEELRQQLKL
ncbi:MAG: hypothetical protein PUP90_13810 [Nostoc sp. S4]|nr:hypothetical protein [Nostoc sp. S4]